MIMHHPSPEILLAYVAGTLAPGLATVTAAHVETCPACQRQVAELSATGGALLDMAEPATMPAQAFDHILPLLDAPAPARRPVHVRQARLGAALPSALRGCVVGRWLWLGAGVRYSKVGLPWAPAANVFLLRVAANRRVLNHGHGDVEFTLVLQGGFSDCTGSYGPGDLAQADSGLQHRPVADAEGCLCLAALEGGMRLPWLARVWPF